MPGATSSPPSCAGFVCWPGWPAGTWPRPPGSASRPSPGPNAGTPFCPGVTAWAGATGMTGCAPDGRAPLVPPFREPSRRAKHNRGGAEAEPVTVRLPGPAKAENGMDRALGLRVRSVPRLGQVPGKPPGAGRDFGAGPRLALAKEVPGEGAR